MNVLWLDHASRYERFDDWLHFHFAKHLGRYVKVFFYGPQMHEKAGQYTPVPYSHNITLNELADRMKLDVVILDSRASSYDNYFPETLYPDRSRGELILPKEFDKCNIKKICIEEDFHYETDCKWHVDLGFKFILQKHYSQSQRKMELPFFFFPFSVDPDVFHPNEGKREQRVGFAGTTNAMNRLSNGSVYRYRESAVANLANHGLLAQQTGHIIKGSYVDYLRKYVAYVCCGSVFDLTSAKMFEIMASGGVLLTNHISGLDVLFSKDSYVEYNQEANNVSELAKDLFNNPDKVTRIVDSAMRDIKTKHTNDIRVRELLNHIERYDEITKK